MFYKDLNSKCPTTVLTQKKHNFIFNFKLKPEEKTLKKSARIKAEKFER